jgi:hypothetical protein
MYDDTIANRELSRELRTLIFDLYWLLSAQDKELVINGEAEGVVNITVLPVDNLSQAIQDCMAYEKSRRDDVIRKVNDEKIRAENALESAAEMAQEEVDRKARISKAEADRIEKEEKHAKFIRNLTPKELARFNLKQKKIKNDRLRALTRADRVEDQMVRNELYSMIENDEISEVFQLQYDQGNTL